MVKFAVCDDEQEVTEYISDKLCEYFPEECEVKTYTDGKNLLDDIKYEAFDAYFLDVGMPLLSGFEIANRIKKNVPHAKIIFVTKKEELAHMGYVYGAFRFVRKSRLDDELRETADSLSSFLSSLSEKMRFKTWMGEIMIDIKSIRYFKANGHTLIAHAQSEKEICAAMREIDELLRDRGFIRIHKSYLVNSRFINSIESSSVKLLSGEVLPMSRNRVNEVRKRLREYCLFKDEKNLT